MLGQAAHHVRIEPAHTHDLFARKAAHLGGLHRALLACELAGKGIDAPREHRLPQHLDERPLAIRQPVREPHIEHAGRHSPPVIERKARKLALLFVPCLAADRLHDELVVAPPFQHRLGKVRGRSVLLHAVEPPCLARVRRVGIVSRRDDPHLFLGKLSLPIVILRREPLEIDGHERVDHGRADGEGVDLRHAAEDRGLGNIADLMVFRHARCERSE